MENTLMYKLSMESRNESFEAAALEYELEIYLQNIDMDAVRSMATFTEEQEQWGIFVPKNDQNASKGSVRVRRTMSEAEGEKFILCVKTSNPEGAGDIENEFEVDEDMFNQFSMMADQGLVKTRLSVPWKTPKGLDVVIELDIFRNVKGEIVPWTKMDIELPEGVTYKDSGIDKDSLPFKFDEIYMVTPEMKESGATYDKSVLRNVGEIYENYFRSTNKHI